MVFAWKTAGLTYNRFLAVAGRALRSGLKEDKRILAERRGQTDLRFSKWQNGKQSEAKSLSDSPATKA